MSGLAHGNSSPRKLIVFGCGYVGSAVVEAAFARGFDVWALTRNERAAAALQAKGVRTIVADLAETSWHDQMPAVSDFVLNCVSSSAPTEDGYRRSYLSGMESIARWTDRNGRIETMVYTSSTSVYLQGDGAHVDESAPVGGNDRTDILMAAENTMARSVDCDRWFALRLAGIYGPRRHHLLDQVRAGEVSGSGAVRLNIVHRDDIADAVFRCFEASSAVHSQSLNIADDCPALKQEVVAWLADRLRLSPPVFSGRSVGRRGITPDRVIVNARAKAVLGWRPRFPSFREGYAAILASAGE